MKGMEDSLIWANAGTYEYSTMFSIFEAKCLKQDFGSERVEERVTEARLSVLFDEDAILFQIFLYLPIQDKHISKHYAQR